MARYGQQFKERVVARLLPPESTPVEEVSNKVGISVTALERWRAEILAKASDDRPRRWTPAARLEAVIFQSRLQWSPLKYNGLPCHSPLQLSSESAAETHISSKSSAVRCKLGGEYGRPVGHSRRRLARS